jgi:translation initiation factor IF-2
MTGKKEKKQNITERPPIVVVMGHVDHGKTKLLDYIRKTNIVEGEAGGITQHIGAYEIEYKGKKITFIDTPGHEAFSKMRSRGAKVADIAILVVAADEGVKPQTVESLNQIKSAGIPYMVAVNKIDRPEANPERVRQQLSEHGVLPEAWGGTVPFCEISAKTGDKVDELLEVLLLMAEMQELKADPDVPGEGVVIESHRDPRIGTVATLLIQTGTVKVGDFIVAGGVCGKIKNIQNFLGKSIETATFSSPIRVIGFSEITSLGQKFNVFSNKSDAERLATENACKEEKICKAAVCGERKTLNLIIKADVQGSKEAIERSIEEKMNYAEAGVNIIKSDVGDINEGDLKLAQSTGAMIAMFNIKSSHDNQTISQTMGVKMIQANIIYDLFDLIKEELKSLIEVPSERTDIGKLDIMAVFKLEREKAIIGGKVVSGKIVKGMKVDVVRGEHKMTSGKIVQLQQNKMDTDEVVTGKECGLMISGLKFENSPDIKEKDHLLVYEEIMKEKVLTPLS